MEQEEVDLEDWGWRMWEVVKGISRRKKIINFTVFLKGPGAKSLLTPQG